MVFKAMLLISASVSIYEWRYSDVPCADLVRVLLFPSLLTRLFAPFGEFWSVLLRRPRYSRGILAQPGLRVLLMIVFSIGYGAIAYSLRRRRPWARTTMQILAILNGAALLVFPESVYVLYLFWFFAVLNLGIAGYLGSDEVRDWFGQSGASVWVNLAMVLFFCSSVSALYIVQTPNGKFSRIVTVNAHWDYHTAGWADWNGPRYVFLNFWPKGLCSVTVNSDELHDYLVRSNVAEVPIRFRVVFTFAGFDRSELVGVGDFPGPLNAHDQSIKYRHPPPLSTAGTLGLSECF